jgi:hypothetical protein
MPSFLLAARTALHAPGAALRAQLVGVAGRSIGPVSEILVKRVCARQGIPFEALTYEHLNGLASTLAEEARPHIGAAAAEQLRERVVGLLDEPA